MKIKTSILLFFFSLCFTTGNMLAQATKFVTLTVDINNVTQDNLQTTCTFGQPEDVSLKDFNLDVEMGDVIIWRGRPAENSTGLVRITEFKHDDGVLILGKRRITEQNGTGVVVGKVQEGDVGDEETYFLKFEVKRGGGQEWEKFIIDPKLKIVQ